jgi:vancomycin resistance protein YoaR
MGMQHAHPDHSPVNSPRNVPRDTAEFQTVASRPRLPSASSLPVLGSSIIQITVVVMAAIFLIVTIGMAALGREIYPEGTVPAGVMVAGIDVGELENGQAAEKLDEELSSYITQPFEVRWEDRTWQPSMAELGASFDFTQTVAHARRSESPMSRVQTRVFGPEERSVPLRLTLDEDHLRDYVRAIAQEVNVSPRVPQLSLVDDRLSISSAQHGIQIEQEVLFENITTSLFSLDTSPVVVTHQEIAPEFSDEDVASVRSLIDSTLSEPLTVWFEDRSWAIQPQSLAEFLTLSPGENGQIELVFHHDPIVSYLADLITDVNRSARNAQVAWGGSGVVATSPSQNGIERDLYGTVARLEEAIRNGERSVELAYSVTRPAIDSSNLHELGIEGLMSQGESAFWNSAPSRVHNIQVAAGYLDGTLIPPGTEFSFNQAVGEISLDRGYQEGYVIEAEATVEGVGGGVCQVSTTVFRAAFFSGLPITERHPHAYIVGYYEQGNWPLGFDAAIFQPGLDFRFVNSTDSYMLLHTHVADGRLYVNLYGPDLGYSVEMGEPVISSETDPPSDVEILDESLAPGQRRQVEEARPGLEITLPRTVTNRNGEVVRQDYFYSNFQPWANRYLVGPSTSPDAQTPDQVPGVGTPSGDIIEGDQTESSGG